MRCVILNALPIQAFKDILPARLYVQPVTPEQLKKLVESCKEIANYIRHPTTVEVLNKQLGLQLSPSSGLYQYREGDTVIVVVLKKPIRGQEVTVNLKDLDFYLVKLEH